MYDPTPIDRNIKKQIWFKKMEWQHKLMLLWLFIDMDQVGIIEPDVGEFCRSFDILSDGDIDLEAFVSDCNNDRKERMMFIDRGKKLWFNPTILFRNSSNAGFRSMVNNQRDLAILRKLCHREETRDWFIEQAIYNDRLEVDEKLIITLHNNNRTTKLQQDFANQIARKLSFKIPKSKFTNDAIKERFGCECQYCRKIFSKSELHIDHVLPSSHGHKDVDQPWNKVPACENCNITKGNKNVFEFINEQGFELSEGVKSAVEKWVKKGVFKYPTQYRDIKRNIKEKVYTWNQVTAWVASNPGLTTSDYQCVNPESPKEEKRWRRK